VRVLGVDDWAWRKGSEYSTILVDLERHPVIDLLRDRTATRLATWLSQHPEVEIVSRDRAGAYAGGIRRGAPQAIQVADRWHIQKNLTEVMEQVLARQCDSTIWVDVQSLEPLPPALVEQPIVKRWAERLPLSDQPTEPPGW
jgi:transposase